MEIHFLEVIGRNIKERQNSKLSFREKYMYKIPFLDDLKHDIFISTMDGGKQMTQTNA